MSFAALALIAAAGWSPAQSFDVGAAPFHEPVLSATLRCLKPVAVRVATWMPSLASYATAPDATA